MMGRKKYNDIDFDQVGHDVHPLLAALIVFAMAGPTILACLLIAWLLR